jgi:hypothetical protein
METRNPSSVQLPMPSLVQPPLVQDRFALPDNPPVLASLTTVWAKPPINHAQHLVEMVTWATQQHGPASLPTSWPAQTQLAHHKCAALASHQVL